MLTLIITGLYLATVVLGVLAKTLWAQTRWANRTISTVWPLIVIAGLGYGIWQNLDTVAERPAFLLYLAMPVILGVLYRIHHWHKRHPGMISGALAGVITSAVRGGRRRTSQKSKRQRMAEDMPAPRGYLSGVAGPWIGLVTTQDTVAWSIAHATALCAGAMIALNITAEVAPFYAVLAVALAVSLLSFSRWRSVDKARQRHIRAMFGTAADQFDYDKAARNAHLPDREAYTRPETTIAVTWRYMIEPDVIVVRFPQTWPKTEMRRREKFAEDWEATFQDSLVKKFEWDTGAQTVRIVPAHYPENARWDGQVSGHWHQFLVGVDLDEGQPRGFSVLNNAPHILVAGETGTGKSEAMFSIAAQAALLNWAIAICDPKGTGWITWTQNYRYTDEYGFQTGAQPLQPGDARPGVVEHATELYGIAAVVRRSFEEMERRKKINAQMKVTNSADIPDAEAAEHGMSPYLLVIDEALSLFATDRGGSEETKERNEIRQEILSTVVRMIVEARALKFHLMLGFQRPDTAYIDGSARDNMGIRIALGELSEDGTRMVFGPGGRVPALPLRKDGAPGEVVRGRGRARFGSGQPFINLQFFWCGPEQADLNKYLPMPEIDPSQIVGTAPAQPHDTHIDEGADLYNPFLDDQGNPIDLAQNGDEETTSEATSTSVPAAPAAPEQAPAPAASAQRTTTRTAPAGDPFKSPAANPWGRTTPAWPGVSTPAEVEQDPASNDTADPAPPVAPAAPKRPSFRDMTRTAPTVARAAATPAADPEPERVTQDGRIVDTGAGREQYSAPVVWESFEPLEGENGSEGTSIFEMGFEDDEIDESFASPAGLDEDAEGAESAEEGSDPEESTAESQAPVAAPTSAPSAPVRLTADDFAFDDLEPAPMPSTPQPAPVRLTADDFAFDDDEAQGQAQEAADPAPQADPAQAPARTATQDDADMSALFTPPQAPQRAAPRPPTSASASQQVKGASDDDGWMF